MKCYWRYNFTPTLAGPISTKEEFDKAEYRNSPMNTMRIVFDEMIKVAKGISDQLYYATDNEE